MLQVRISLTPPLFMNRYNVFKRFREQLYGSEHSPSATVNSIESISLVVPASNSSVTDKPTIFCSDHPVKQRDLENIVTFRKPCYFKMRFSNSRMQAFISNYRRLCMTSDQFVHMAGMIKDVNRSLCLPSHLIIRQICWPIFPKLFS